MNWYKVIGKNRKGEVTHLCNITVETKEQALIHALNIYRYLRVKGVIHFAEK